MRDTKEQGPHSLSGPRHKDHGKIRVKQYYEIDEGTGHGRNTDMVIEQNDNGIWKRVQVQYINEDDAND